MEDKPPNFEYQESARTRKLLLVNFLLQVAILYTAQFQFFGYDSPNYLFKMPLLGEPFVVVALQWGLIKDVDSISINRKNWAMNVTKYSAMYFLACWLAVFCWTIYSGL